MGVLHPGVLPPWGRALHPGRVSLHWVCLQQGLHAGEVCYSRLGRPIPGIRKVDRAYLTGMLSCFETKNSCIYLFGDAHIHITNRIFP